ncbi:copper chaperone PCu(A)C [Gallaecimonas kandeliae]|uniref:copper chaperone PCu(A)C n=1 Tax=Gallaecimonas kandeliae TaxID=3029055 RepID=UPI0026487646|nr:copper chaperone PCu(A)C [Gallaecimonas kandeliae]WKE66266.1 copper chaperone PCu(A)C [Gallaecimonas kandeliae]
MKYAISTLLWLALATASVTASTALWAGELEVENPWVRLMPPGVATTAAYMKLRNQGSKAVTIQKVESTDAGKVMLHGYRNDGDKLHMVPMDSLTLAPGEVVSLEPGALHLMLMGLTHGLSEGQPLTLTLYYSDGQSQQILAEPRAPQ